MEENRELYIVDASVVLKWFLEEIEDQKNALELRQDYFENSIDLVSPHYIFAEVMNTLGRKSSHVSALSAFATLLTYNLPHYRTTLELASLAVELMKEFPGISFYDAGYHALALQHGGTFVTGDKKYYEKTKKRGHIMLLKQYGKKR